MTTVINNPGVGETGDSAVGMIVGVILLLVVVGLFFVYALPAIRGNSAAPRSDTVDVNVKFPAGGTSPTPAPKPSAY